MPPIGVLFAFLVADVVMSVELSFSWYSMRSSWMRSFMVYYSESVNFVILGMAYEFLKKKKTL